ncbi:putative bifunctional diguanylate cyclase/phosphodiesterase [Pararobbsia silviterrae]|uniref:EAL domain-containing protein n=1 Tax=Pararobbsia silviterrae TaxID=1792498 RepID=A0A494XSW2_9BURK|nr:EAL domain-containing protein [Pararobbsia silviterrae]RKP53720.1 EAL domain-containing protein [Pararobbsia silviterrae]
MNTSATMTASTLQSASLSYVLDRIGAYVYVKDHDGRYVFANGAVCELFGAAPAQVIGAPDAHFIDLDRSQRMLANDRAVLDSGETIHDEEELCLLGGTVRAFWTTKVPVLDEEGQVIAVCGISTDITHRNWAEEHLVGRNHLLSKVLAHIDACVYVKDREGRYLFANQRVLELYGRASRDIVGKTDLEIHGRDVGLKLTEMDQRVISTNARLTCEEVVVGTDGVEHNYWSVKLPLDIPGKPSGVIGFSTDITELLRLRQIVERQRTTDALTDLPNRAQFEEELALELRMASRVRGVIAVALLDFDQFKYINTLLGQEIGDQLLREAAERLRRALAPRSSLARISGDAFVATLFADDESDLIAQVEALRALLAEPFTLLGKPVRVTASAGLAGYPHDADVASALVDRAEAAMYRAKNRGRDQVCRYTADLAAIASHRLALESDLRAALADAQFELHYQPKIGSADGRVMGFEALLRWNRPGHGRVSPLEFIPLAEELGLLVPIGAWVITQACRQMAQWRDQGLGRIRVAVNLSPSQLKSADLIDGVRASMTSHGIEPNELEMEVTESMMMDDPEQAIATLNRLRGEGVRLSIDDFGTGYSSMAYLKRLPVDTLKLDRNFITGIDKDTRDADLCAGMIALAHKLGLSVIAEGVETEAQRSALVERACDVFQGYLFSPPMAAADVAAFLKGKVVA